MCLAEEFKYRGIGFERQCSFPLAYRETIIESAYRIDFLVEGQVIIEIKAVEAVSPIHLAQLLTYLRLLNIKRGLLLNFNVTLLKDGIRRVSNEFSPLRSSAFFASLR
jgi:GxxExxY protein